MGSDEKSAPTGAKLIVKKVGGALFTDVQVKPAFDFTSKFGTLGFSGIMFNRFQKAFGGVWVGGDLELFEDRLRFEPNILNTAIQIHDLSREIKLSEVTKVAWRFGAVTGIVDVTHGGGCFSFRCYGSMPLTTAIESAVSAVRSPAR